MKHIIYTFLFTALLFLQNGKSFGSNNETIFQADDITGYYQIIDSSYCKFDLEITKSDNQYFYNINTENQNFKGEMEISVSDNEIIISFTEIEWAEYGGMLDDDGEPVRNDLEKPIGIDAEWKNGEIFFQNYGNSMNYYTKFMNCGEKFITLRKIKPFN